MNQLSIQLSNEAIARGLELASERGAESLEQLIELLLLDGGSPQAVPCRPEGPTTIPDRLAPPAAPLTHPLELDVNPAALTLDAPTAPLAMPLAVDFDFGPLPLPFLTNRLSPLKASVRALANLAIAEGAWPRIRDFQAKAGHAARERGLKLRAEDQAAGRRGRHKRSVAWPIGANPATALQRFAYAFTLTVDGSQATGPLATLGLATVVDGRAQLTEAGWDLVAAPSPVLDGGNGTLSRDEALILVRQLQNAPAEREAIAEFLRAVRRAAGAQPRVDELLGVWHSDWSSEQAAAQRSAMIGRLEELELVSVSGRGTNATIILQQPDGISVGIEERTAA